MTYDQLYYLPGTTVLQNRFAITDPGRLRQVEHLLSAVNLATLPPVEISLDGYRQINHHLYRDLYDWAGDLRQAPAPLTGHEQPPTGADRIGGRPPYECLDCGNRLNGDELDDHALAHHKAFERDHGLLHGAELENYLEAQLDALPPPYDEIDNPYAVSPYRTARVAAGTAYTLSTLRPFPAGNDLTMRIFLNHLTSYLGHRLDFNSLTETEWRYAMHQLGNGHREPLVEIVVAHNQKLDTTALAQTILDWAETQFVAESIDELVEHAELSLSRAASAGERGQLNETIGRLHYERDLAVRNSLSLQDALYHDAFHRGMLTWHAQRSADPNGVRVPGSQGLTALGAARQTHDAWTTTPAEPFRASLANQGVAVAKDLHRHWASSELLRTIDNQPPPQRITP